MPVEKINVTLPTETLAKLRRFVPAGERSRVVAEATAQYLETLTQKKAFHRAAGLWKDRAELRTQADVNRALKELRGATASRLKHLTSRG